MLPGSVMSLDMLLVAELLNEKVRPLYRATVYIIH